MLPVLPSPPLLPAPISMETCPPAPSPACTLANLRKSTCCTLRSCLDGGMALRQAVMLPTSTWQPCPALTGGHAKLRVGSCPCCCSPEQGKAGHLLISTLPLLCQPSLSILPPSVSPALFTSVKHWPGQTRFPDKHIPIDCWKEKLLQSSTFFALGINNLQTPPTPSPALHLGEGDASEWRQDWMGDVTPEEDV